MMFDQFKENIQLTGETYGQARQGIKARFESFKKAPRFQKAIWMSIIGGIVVSSAASKFSIPWYYQGVLVLGVVLLPVRLWVGRANGTNS